MVKWGPFSRSISSSHPSDSFIGSKITEKLNFKVSDSRISKHPVIYWDNSNIPEEHQPTDYLGLVTDK